MNEGGCFSMRKTMFALSVLGLALLGAPVAAFAQTPDATAQVTTLATTGFAQIVPIIIAVAGAAVGMAVVWFGARLVLGTLSKGRLGK